jgi:catechol 2,3-dioxygenase-like lactoylglutathione lyase family enzyme
MRVTYPVVGTNDLEKARHFYDELFRVLNVERLWSFDRGTCYGAAMTESFAVMTPYDGKPATAGNGTMVFGAVALRPARTRLVVHGPPVI